MRDRITGSAVAWPANAFVLAAYLLLEGAGGQVRRRDAALLLFDDAGRESASASLRSLLARIRRTEQTTGFRLLAADREHVWLTDDADIDVRRLNEISGESAADALELCEIYRGDLLDDFDESGARSEEWLQEQRTRLRDTYIASVTKFLERASPNSQTKAIETVARKLIAVDPYQEVSYRALMRLYATAGRLRDLERVYRSCRARFERDLGVGPDRQTERLYRDLCAQDQAELTGDTEPESAGRVSAQAAAAAAHVPPATRGPPGICVLMPAHQSSGQAYDLAAALIEDVTIGLCAQRSFTVIAPYTAWRLGPDGPEGDFANAFGIDYVVQTRILQNSGDTLLAAKLLNARSRRIDWADRFAFDTADPRGSYRSLGLRIITSLTEAIENAELDRHRRSGGASAYVAYLLGARALSTVQLPSVRAARALFKSSVKQDGGFAPALSGIARTLHMEWLLLARGEPQLLDEAELYSRRALEADSESAEGLRELGLCRLYKGMFDESLDTFAEAERRNPQHADLLADYADALSMGGMPVDALGKVEQATALNPLCPDRYRWYAGTIHYQLEHYDAAIDALTKMADSSPAHKLLAACWAMLGEPAKAREYARMVLRTYPEFTVGDWLSMIPIRDEALKRHYEQGLRSAGFS